MKTSITLLNDLSFAIGLIGLAEMHERTEVSLWLADETGSIADPREESSELTERSVREPCHEDEVLKPVATDQKTGKLIPVGDEPQWLRFLVLKKWHFTLGDVDCVPSVPHGHENAKTQSWPKLNPYTGRVFSAIHREDVSQRLDRNEMRLIWRNKDFVERCRRQVIWYANNYQNFPFPHARRGLLHFPRW